MRLFPPNPAAAGAHGATVSIASNDSDENPFTFVIAGRGLTARESWRQQYFGTTENSGHAADSFDFENDGISNLLEWAVHLDPTASSLFPPGWSMPGRTWSSLTPAASRP